MKPRAHDEQPNHALRALPAFAGAILLAGCTGSVIPRAAPGASLPPSLPPVTAAQQNAGVLGLDARALVRAFGEPRLDIQDPAARKLQFGDGRCILDTYLYPARARGEPVVAYAEARRPDGEDMDWAACANQLRGR